ncbi:hypothetical protein L208DRAFT_858748 [Tricholoma matsutake]|nr:hypothetical protein L208DRAFT_858748 [Tricholoma matsutake 945]
MHTRRDSGNTTSSSSGCWYATTGKSVYSIKGAPLVVVAVIQVVGAKISRRRTWAGRSVLRLYVSTADCDRAPRYKLLTQKKKKNWWFGEYRRTAAYAAVTASSSRQRGIQNPPIGSITPPKSNLRA